MYKESAITIMIILFIIFLSIITTKYTNYCYDIILNKLEILRKEVVKDEVDEQDLNTKINDIYKNWEKMYRKLAYYIEHDELEKTQVGLTQLKSNIETEEYEEATARLDETIFLFYHIKEKERLSLENIF